MKKISNINNLVGEEGGGFLQTYTCNVKIWKSWVSIRGGVLPYITYTLYGYVPLNGVVILKLLI